MMLRYFLSIGLGSFFYLWCGAQSNQKHLQDIRVDVIYLASDFLQGRETGTFGEELACLYISERFRAIGLKPMGESGTYLQPFPFNFPSSPHSTEGEARIGKNVIGYIDNQAEQTVVIGAHYDHLGRGAFGSLYLDGPLIHNGADDNASGVGSLLLLAKMLKEANLKHNNYLFIAFSGEELGLYGSKYFVKHPTLDLAKLNYMLNMDMVGKLSQDKTLVINGTGTSPIWKETLPKLKVNGIKIQEFESGVGASDHTSFYLENLPVLHFFTGSHEDYHKPSDDSERINFEGILDVTEYIFELIQTLDGKPKLAFTKTKDEQRQAASFKVTLGVMPDYTYAGQGMRVDAVLDDRPAQAAGIEKGDVIIQLGDLKVKDIYDYMNGLGRFEKGQETTVVVKRGDKELKKKVVF